MGGSIKLPSSSSRNGHPGEDRHGSPAEDFRHEPRWESLQARRVLSRVSNFDDLNEDGTADPGELKTLAELGITYIPLTHDGKSHRLSDGSRINGTNVTVTSNGKSLTVADVALRLGTRNAALTVSPNGVNIRPGDGTVQNFYSGNGNRDALGWEPRDTRQRFFGEMTARA